MIQSLSSKIDERTEGLQDLSKRIEEIEGNIKSFERNIETAQARISANEKTIAHHKRMFKEITETIERLQSELRYLYDDIVTQLDTQLTETGYSHQKRKAAEESLVSSVKALIIHIQGRRNLLHDSQELKSSSAADKDRIIKSFSEFLDDGIARAEELDRIVSDFRDAVPAFIDDFLAPEGIITRKREIDRAIVENQHNLADHRKQAEDLEKENKHQSGRIEEYRKTLEDLRVARVQMRSQRSSIEEAISLLKTQRTDHENQLEDSRREIKNSEKSLGKIEKNIESLKVKKAALNILKKLYQFPERLF